MDIGNTKGVYGVTVPPEGRTETNKFIFPYKQASGRNGDHEWPMTARFWSLLNPYMSPYV